MQKVFHSLKAFDWSDDTKHTIRIYKVDDQCDDSMYYVIKVDGEFWSKNETCPEVEKEVHDIIDLYDWKLVPRS